MAAAYGHLTVLRILVEQYGGSVLHREKVKCYMITHHFLMYSYVYYRKFQYPNLVLFSHSNSVSLRRGCFTKKGSQKWGAALKRFIGLPG